MPPRLDATGLHDRPGHAVDAYEVEPLRQVFALRGRYRLGLLRTKYARIATGSCGSAFASPMPSIGRCGGRRTDGRPKHRDGKSCNHGIAGARSPTNFVGTIALRRTAYCAGSTVAQMGSLATATSTFSAGWVGSRTGCEKNGQRTQMAAALVDGLACSPVHCVAFSAVAWSAFARHAHLLIFSFVLTVLPPHSSPNNCSAGP